MRTHAQTHTWPAARIYNKWLAGMTLSLCSPSCGPWKGEQVVLSFIDLGTDDEGIKDFPRQRVDVFTKAWRALIRYIRSPDSLPLPPWSTQATCRAPSDNPYKPDHHSHTITTTSSHQRHQVSLIEHQKQQTTLQLSKHPNKGTKLHPTHPPSSTTRNIRGCSSRD